MKRNGEVQGGRSIVLTTMLLNFEQSAVGESEAGWRAEEVLRKEKARK